ncbi:MAG: SDR family oxidoreductase [Candidatus Omnitrophota bacterium]
MPQNKKDIFSLKGKIAVVTGGLGQLGVQFSLVLAQRQAKVAIFDIKTKNIPGVIKKYIDNGKIKCFYADVTKPDSIKGALEKTKSSFGSPDILINNAAIDSAPDAPYEENGPFEEYPESSWDKVMDANLKGVFLCSQIIGKEMAKLKRGSVINISSIYGLLSPDQRIYEYRRKKGRAFYKPVAYSVSKSGVLNLTRYLAAYWADFNVRVNTLTFAGVFNNQDTRFLKNYTKKLPMARMAREDEYNGAVVFLASDASSYMTGSNLVIDGGYSCW